MELADTANVDEPVPSTSTPIPIDPLFADSLNRHRAIEPDSSRSSESDEDADAVASHLIEHAVAQVLAELPKQPPRKHRAKEKGPRDPNVPRPRSGGPAIGRQKRVIEHLKKGEYSLLQVLWGEENTKCYMLEVVGCAIGRREGVWMRAAVDSAVLTATADNDMINGTKLLNFCKVTRGK